MAALKKTFVDYQTPVMSPNTEKTRVGKIPASKRGPKASTASVKGAGRALGLNPSVGGEKKPVTKSI